MDGDDDGQELDRKEMDEDDDGQELDRKEMDGGKEGQGWGMMMEGKEQDEKEGHGWWMMMKGGCTMYIHRRFQFLVV